MVWVLVEHRVGWPMRCLQYLGDPAGSSEQPRRDIPLRPLWPGFALNTLFYAAIAWGLWRIPILIRRHHRRTRGLCLRCAYNRADLTPNAPCPECGHTPGPTSSMASAA